jgi:hypothetical protein
MKSTEALTVAVANRNNALKFAERTFKNLRFLQGAHERGEDVHVVTQLANSLLGLVVFPWERHFVRHIEGLQLVNLHAQGWPEWNVTLGRCSTLGELARHLRNAAAHGRITYCSEGLSVLTDTLTVEDLRPQSSRPYWRASISGNELRRFCERFIELIEDTIGRNVPRTAHDDENTRAGVEPTS